MQRNLGIAYQHENQLAKAIAALEKAVSLERKYPLHFTELDELYGATAADPEKRLALLEKNHGVVARRDDSLAREISLKVTAGKYDDAIQLMAVWERESKRRGGLVECAPAAGPLAARGGAAAGGARGFCGCDCDSGQFAGAGTRVE